jgi:hypothetical protein
MFLRSACKKALKPLAMEACGKFNLFLASARMPETWRVEGGLTAPREGFGDFALNPQKEITSSKKNTLNCKKSFCFWLIQGL